MRKNPTNRVSIITKVVIAFASRDRIEHVWDRILNELEAHGLYIPGIKPLVYNPGSWYPINALLLCDDLNFDTVRDIYLLTRKTWECHDTTEEVRKVLNETTLPLIERRLNEDEPERSENV